MSPAVRCPTPVDWRESSQVWEVCNGSDSEDPSMSAARPLHPTPGADIRTTCRYQQ